MSASGHFRRSLTLHMCTAVVYNVVLPAQATQAGQGLCSVEYWVQRSVLLCRLCELACFLDTLRLRQPVAQLTDVRLRSKRGSHPALQQKTRRAIL